LSTIDYFHSTIYVVAAGRGRCSQPSNWSVQRAESKANQGAQYSSSNVTNEMGLYKNLLGMTGIACPFTYTGKFPSQT